MSLINPDKLDRLIYSHPLGWAPVGEVEKFLSFRGVKIKQLEGHNKTDGGYNKSFVKDGHKIDLLANCWDAKTFEPLIKWYSGVNNGERNNDKSDSDR